MIVNDIWNTFFFPKMYLGNFIIDHMTKCIYIKSSKSERLIYKEDIDLTNIQNMVYKYPGFENHSIVSYC